ncbi:MAG: hypothetical protein IK128_03335 [Clostridiales bacterium]|nr:hypothetical protein [Clostridiales bacterium]
MDWNDFDASTSWIDRFSYYLDPANSANVSKEDLLSALSVAVAMYCDEYQNTCLLEDKIISAFGEEALEKVIEDGTPEDDVVRYVAAGEALTTDARAKLALGYLEDLKKGDGEDT